MRQETLTVNNVEVIVRSRTRRTAIVEAQIKQAIVKAHPEITDYEAAQYAVAAPNLPIDIDGNPEKKRNPQQELALLDYSRQLVIVRNQHPVGSAYADEMNRFASLAARINLMPEEKVYLDAFEAWLDGANDELWTTINEAIKRLDAPLTDVIQRPPETLTEVEEVDPLSLREDGIGESV